MLVCKIVKAVKRKQEFPAPYPSRRFDSYFQLFGILIYLFVSEGQKQNVFADLEDQLHFKELFSFHYLWISKISVGRFPDSNSNVFNLI